MKPKLLRNLGLGEARALWLKMEPMSGKHRLFVMNLFSGLVCLSLPVILHIWFYMVLLYAHKRILIMVSLKVGRSKTL